MVTFLMFLLLVAILYEFIIYNYYQEKTVAKSEKETTNISSLAPQPEDADIIGKSTFNMKAEMERRRKVKEEVERKVAVARGEMTEDGKEIAQEVKPEDCEVETKKVVVQVPDEELDDIFSEQDVPMANGDIINDLDLKFGVNRCDLDEEEERRISENMYKALDETVLLDDICNQAPEVGREIRRMIDKYKKEMSEAIEQTKEDESMKPLQQKFTMAERYADFDVEDLV